MGLIQGIHHVSMKCCNAEEYEQAIRFYKDILGLKAVREWKTGIMFETGAGLIEIFNDADAQLDKGTIRHFAFAVEDVDACVKAVTDAGYEVSMEPKDIAIPSNPELPARIAFCNGPLGEEIEFFQEK
jgi:glyoxylase I family protein